jgi:hypothetical protein
MVIRLCVLPLIRPESPMRAQGQIGDRSAGSLSASHRDGRSFAPRPDLGQCSACIRLLPVFWETETHPPAQALVLHLRCWWWWGVRPRHRFVHALGALVLSSPMLSEDVTKGSISVLKLLPAIAGYQTLTSPGW